MVFFQSQNRFFTEQFLIVIVQFIALNQLVCSLIVSQSKLISELSFFMP